MTREAFIDRFDSAFIDLVTEKWVEEYNLGYTSALLGMALTMGIITLREYTFLSVARRYACEERA